MRRRVPLALLVLTALTLLTLDAGTDAIRPYVRAARTATASVVAPLQRATVEVTSSDTASRTNSAELRRLRAANARLRAENGLLRAQSTLGPNPAAVRAVGEENLLPARVLVTRTGGTHGHTAQLDVGRADGVRVGAGVIAHQGVLGRVLRTGRSVCTVLLLTDPRSTVGVRHDDSRRLGLLDGRGGTPTLRMVDRDTRLSTGDRLATWGSPGGTPYPPGIPVGSVTGLDRRRDGGSGGSVARVEPAVDPTAVRRVVVVR